MFTSVVRTREVNVKLRKPLTTVFNYFAYRSTDDDKNVYLSAEAPNHRVADWYWAIDALVLGTSKF